MKEVLLHVVNHIILSELKYLLIRTSLEKMSILMLIKQF
jgi:hypothetical protein